MTLDYFYGQSGELFAYFRIPKALFQDSRFRQPFFADKLMRSSRMPYSVRASVES